MKCPNCGTRSEGKFCQSCGTPLAVPGHCASCGAKLDPGARFCTRCGEAVGGRRSNLSLPWLVAGGAIIVAIIVILLPVIRGESTTAGAPSPTAPFAGTMGSGSGTPPPLSGSPREQADRLFNRIMEAQSAGNMDEARMFLPMAIQAYEMVEPLDTDGLYHLSLIHGVAGDHAAAIAVANRILEQAPTHLLGLAALAEASTASGDTAAAASAWNTFLDNLESERAKPVQEYTDHARILTTYEQSARQATGR
jgi:predicted nucleic acid-binding Zn ribbon protein